MSGKRARRARQEQTEPESAAVAPVGVPLELRFAAVSWILIWAWLVIGAGAYWSHVPGPPLGMLWRWLGEQPWFALFRPSGGAALIAIAIWALALWVGRAALRLLRVPHVHLWVTVAFSGVLGAALFAYLFFLLGVLRVLGAPSLAAGIVLLVAGASWLNRDLYKAEPWLAARTALFDGSGIAGKIAAAFVALVLAFGWVNGLGPEIFYDSLVYHLAIPKLALLEGRLVPTVHNAYEGIPMVVQFFFGVGLAFGDDTVARLQAWGFAALLVAGLLAGSVKLTERLEAGWLAALIFLGTPLVLLKLSITNNDIPLSAFVVVSLVALASAADSDDEHRRAWLLLAGIVSGAALATKYTIWPWLAPSAGWLLYTRWKSPDRWRAPLLFSCVALAVLSPWVVKNVIFYGNPVFPVWNNIITDTPGAVADWVRLNNDTLPRKLGKQFSTLSGVWDWLLSFWTVAWDGHTKAPDADASGPLYALFFPLILLVRWKRPLGALAVISFSGLLLVFLLTTRITRYVMPGFAVLALLIGAFAAARDPVLRHAGRFTTALVFVFSVSGIIWASPRYFDPGNSKVAFGLAERSAFLADQHGTYPLPSYAGAAWINEHTPATSRILVVGDGRGFFLERPFIASSVVNRSPLALWAEWTKSPDELAAKLESEGVTHVLVNFGEGYRTRSYKHFYLSKDGAERIAATFARHLNLIWQDQPRSLFVYELLDAPKEATLNAEPAKLPVYAEIRP